MVKGKESPSEGSERPLEEGEVVLQEASAPPPSWRQEETSELTTYGQFPQQPSALQEARLAQVL